MFCFSLLLYSHVVVFFQRSDSSQSWSGGNATRGSVTLLIVYRPAKFAFDKKRAKASPPAEARNLAITHPRRLWGSKTSFNYCRMLTNNADRPRVLLAPVKRGLCHLSTTTGHPPPNNSSSAGRVCNVLHQRSSLVAPVVVFFFRHKILNVFASFLFYSIYMIVQLLSPILWV